MINKLQEVRDWAKEKIASGEEPPWAWFQYMKLIETADAILGGYNATTTASSPQLASLAGKHLQLVDSKYPQDNAQPRHASLPTQMPM